MSSTRRRPRHRLCSADKRTFKYDKLLPNLGFIYDFTPQISAFASYSKGLSVPSTDNLYNAFFFPEDTDEAKPKPETTDSFDGGLRYRSTKIQAQARLVHQLQRSHGVGLRSGTERPCSATSARSTSGASTARRLRANPGVDALCVRFVEQVEDQGQHPDRRGFLPRRRCDNIDPSTTHPRPRLQLRLHRRQPEAGSPNYTYGFSAGHDRPGRSRHMPSGRARATSSTTMPRCSAVTSTLRRHAATDPFQIFGEGRRPTGWSTSTPA